jgi:hypothetical protein
MPKWRRLVGEVWTNQKESARPLLRKCVDGLLILSIVLGNESLDSRRGSNTEAWRKTVPCGSPAYTIPDIHDSVAVANLLEPYWFLDEAEPADPERDMVVVFQAAVSPDEDTLVMTYSVTYTEDYGNNGLGLVLGDIFALQPKIQVLMDLGITANPHDRDVETVRLVAKRSGDSDQWFLRKLLVNQHRLTREYYFSEDSPLVCYQGNPALLVEQGKHAARISLRDCNRGSLLSVLGLRIGPNHCRVKTVYHPPLTPETEAPFFPPGHAVLPEEETITVNLGGEVVILRPLSQPCIARRMGVCRASYGFDQTQSLLDGSGKNDHP